MVLRFAAFGLAVLSCGLAFAQTPPARPAFEVVSIKPGPSETMMALAQSGRLRSRIDDAQVDLGSFPLSNLIEFAYGLPSDRISGPNWVADARFDILAKLPAGASRSQVPEMMQTMLAERFHLVVHHDRRVMPVYTLVVGKPPLRLQESAEDDSEPNPCNGGRGGHHTCHKVSMEQLASLLTSYSQMPFQSTSWAIDRPVIDMTGLKGVYDFSLDYGRVGGRGGRSGEPASGSADDVTEISLVDAVNHLGLKLEPAKHAFDFIVIDHVDRVPTEN
jgi:uncharacterized protein (TIGR03435 family)